MTYHKDTTLSRISLIKMREILELLFDQRILVKLALDKVNFLVFSSAF